MDKGIFIEQLVSIIEETLQGNENVKIFHDYEMEDKHGNKRQIDVLIEYKQNDRFTFRTAIECKYKGRDGVEVNQMHAFKSTLESIPEIHRGIFVSTSGFQKSAIPVAKEANIWLYELNDLTKEDVKSWYRNAPKVSKTIKKYEVIDWRILMREEDKGLIRPTENLTVSPDAFLSQDNGNNIVIRDLISAIAPFRANQLHNHLLNESILGYDVYKDIFVNISIFPLQSGVYYDIKNRRLPIGFLEIKIKFWLELENVEQTVYKLYKDHEGTVVADIINAKVDYSDEGVYLNIIENPTSGSKGYYFTDGGKKKIKLEIDAEITISDKNQTTVIMKNPYPVDKV
jgi:hypothetical protein